jgi:hypothetical protein
MRLPYADTTQTVVGAAVEEAEPLGERGQLLALLVRVGGSGGHDDAGHALRGECLDPFAGHADRSPAHVLQRIGATAHVDGGRPTRSADVDR